MEANKLRTGWLLLNVLMLFLVMDKSSAQAVTRDRELCTNGNLRLNNTFLEICKNFKWRSVCDDDWSALDATVACKQLGYDGGYTTSTSARRSSKVYRIEYRCTGRESNLRNCTNRRLPSYVFCYGINIACVEKNESDSCNSGDIRLWGGETEYEGNIELCTDRGVWSAVADTSWSSADAVVACKHLGYTNFIAVPTYGSEYGKRYQPMEYGGLTCRGNETSLLNCTTDHTFVYSEFTNSNQNNYAGVKCLDKKALNTNCINETVRLAHGYSSNNGLAEVCIDGIWLGICTEPHPAWNTRFPRTRDVVAMDVCRKLGYQRAIQINESVFPSNRSQPPAFISLTPSCIHSSFFGYSSVSSRLRDCISSSRYSGIEYSPSCHSITVGALCCPNDISQCGFGQLESPSASTASPTCSPPPSVIPTKVPQAPGPTTNKEVSFCFGTAATSLIVASSADLRGFKMDIHDKIRSCFAESHCSVVTTTATDEFLLFKNEVVYRLNLEYGCEENLRECLTSNPWIQYLQADIRLSMRVCGY